MSKPPSDKTMLARLKREKKGLIAQHLEMMDLVNKSRARATKAEQEAAEWKGRFDQVMAMLRAVRNPDLAAGDQA